MHRGREKIETIMASPHGKRLPIFATASCPSGTRSDVEMRGHGLVIDEPPETGGEDAGARPLEVLMAAFAGCTNVIANRIASEMGVTLRNLRLVVGGDLDMGVIMGQGGNPFPLVELRVEGETDASEPQLARLKEALARRCPVSVLLRGAGCDVREVWKLHPLR